VRFDEPHDSLGIGARCIGRDRDLVPVVQQPEDPAIVSIVHDFASFPSARPAMSKFFERRARRTIGRLTETLMGKFPTG